jgi:endonuclease/exonuclease/phosphatase family metal-dependent hydrolase
LLRLLSYNVHDLLDDADAVAHVVRSCRPDVACLQEVPRRSVTGRRVRRLARETGLRWTAGGRGSGGTAVFTSPRVDVLAASAGRLPVAGPFTRTRGYALARLSGLTVVSVHLPLRAAERVAHAELVLDVLRGQPQPWVVAGDLNESPDGAAWSVFGAALLDAFGGTPAGTSASGPAEPGAPASGLTYPARAPRRRIDAALVSPGVVVERCVVASADEHLSPADLQAASDHLPVLVDLRLNSPA